MHLIGRKSGARFFFDQSRGTSTKQITFDTKLKICCFHGEIRAVNNSYACSCVASKNQALVKKTLMSLVTCDHFTAQGEVKYCETLKPFRFVLLRFRLIYFSAKKEKKQKQKKHIYIYEKVYVRGNKYVLGPTHCHLSSCRFKGTLKRAQTLICMYASEQKLYFYHYHFREHRENKKTEQSEQSQERASDQHLHF